MAVRSPTCILSPPIPERLWAPEDALWLPLPRAAGNCLLLGANLSAQQIRGLPCLPVPATRRCTRKDPAPEAVQVCLPPLGSPWPRSCGPGIEDATAPGLHLPPTFRGLPPESCLRIPSPSSRHLWGKATLQGQGHILPCSLYQDGHLERRESPGGKRRETGREGLGLVGVGRSPLRGGEAFSQRAVWTLGFREEPGKPGPDCPQRSSSLSHLTLNPPSLPQRRFPHLLAWLRLYCEEHGTLGGDWNTAGPQKSGPRKVTAVDQAHSHRGHSLSPCRWCWTPLDHKRSLSECIFFLSGAALQRLDIFPRSQMIKPND